MQSDRPTVLPPRTGPEDPSSEGPGPVVLEPRRGLPSRLAGARVLVVEDDDDSRELICALLTMAGAKVLCVESVAAAMDGVYHLFDPDVVLTDFSMPDANGLDLIREFRKAPTT